jgi:hypothetical protein
VEEASMPVNATVVNEHRLFLTYFYGPVPLAEVYEAADRVTAEATGVGVYRGLVIFERDISLAEWDGAAIQDMSRYAAGIYSQLGLVRGESAAVVNFVPEAQLVMRLWNALCSVDWAMNMAFNVFWDLEPALRFLDAPSEVHRRVFELAASVRE